MSINLLNYYKDNIKEDDPYYRFHDIFNDYDIDPVIIANKIAAINRFKELCEPKLEQRYDLNPEFLLICYYLNHNNYYIDLFPSFLESPTSLSDFTSFKIKNYIRERDKVEGNITWRSRRILVSNLNFIIKNGTEVEYICINGFLYNLKTNSGKILNGSIIQ